MKKRIFSFFMTCVLCLLSSVYLCSAVSSEYADTPAVLTHPPRLVDNAELLSVSEASTLENMLDEVSERQNMDVVIATVNSLEGKTASEFADDFYDYNGYGLGSSYDGLILLIDMGSRKWAISTCGYAIDVFTDESQSNITDSIVPLLSDGEYFEAFTEFCNLCDRVMTASDEYGMGNYDTVFENVGSRHSLELYWIPVSIAIGGFIAFIVLGVMKSKLKTVRPENDADCYIRPGSINIVRSNEIFLYRNVTKTRRQTNNSTGGGGSSTHRGSSGRTHGGSSGRF